MPFNRPAFLQAVFAPRADERVLVLVDQPTDNCPDHPDWQARRAMAAAWGQDLAALGADYLGMLTYPATGANNGDLPAHGLLHGRPVAMAQSLAAADLVLALTEYSATAPLLAAIRASGGRLRAASLPGVLPRMETTALTVDVPRLARRVAYLRAALDQAVGAQLVFSTGHQVYFDLRHRQAHGDDGRLPPAAAGRLINLPSGEAYIAPYEGERPDDPSQTAGELPVATPTGMALCLVSANRIYAVQGEGAGPAALRALLAADSARANVAELGLGCNDRAVVTGNVLEDEKAGLHWAYGRSEHLGGTVGPTAFRAPENVLHSDVVYAPGCPITARELTLIPHSGPPRPLIANGAYLNLPD